MYIYFSFCFFRVLGSMTVGGMGFILERLLMYIYNKFIINRRSGINSLPPTAKNRD